MRTILFLALLGTAAPAATDYMVLTVKVESIKEISPPRLHVIAGGKKKYTVQCLDKTKVFIEHKAAGTVERATVDDLRKGQYLRIEAHPPATHTYADQIWILRE